MGTLSGLQTLRQYAKYRVLNDMAENVRRHGSKDYMVMVVDESALKVFSSCVKFFDLFCANFYHFEKLEVKRKKFSHTEAIYFMSPVEKSVDRLLEDFKVVEGGTTKLQYKAVHLCFLSSVS